MFLLLLYLSRKLQIIKNNDIEFHIKKFTESGNFYSHQEPEARKKAQLLRALAALAEDKVQFPVAHQAAHSHLGLQL